MSNLFKRIITSIFLLTIIIGCLLYHKYLWLSLLVIVSVISFYEFNILIKKIYKKNIKIMNLINIIVLLYLLFFIYTSYLIGANSFELTLFILSICILSDTGGYIVGKTFGGKKLTKISPNKTISGSIGSFVFSMFPLTVYNYYEFNLLYFIIFIFLLSLISQCGDLLISYFKRKAKVKDTGAILPGHGGILDRIDVIIFAVPAAFILINLIKL